MKCWKCELSNFKNTKGHKKLTFRCLYDYKRYDISAVEFDPQRLVLLACDKNHKLPQIPDEHIRSAAFLWQAHVKIEIISLLKLLEDYPELYKIIRWKHLKSFTFMTYRLDPFDKERLTSFANKLVKLKPWKELPEVWFDLGWKLNSFLNSNSAEILFRKGFQLTLKGFGINFTINRKISLMSKWVYYIKCTGGEHNIVLAKLQTIEDIQVSNINARVYGDSVLQFYDWIFNKVKVLEYKNYELNDLHPDIRKSIADSYKIKPFLYQYILIPINKVDSIRLTDELAMVSIVNNDNSLRSPYVMKDIFSINPGIKLILDTSEEAATEGIQPNSLSMISRVRAAEVVISAKSNYELLNKLTLLVKMPQVLSIEIVRNSSFKIEEDVCRLIADNWHKDIRVRPINQDN